jgi:hypothetical protein
MQWPAKDGGIASNRGSASTPPREPFQFPKPAAAALGAPRGRFDKAAVAELSDEQISHMSREELIEVVRHAQLPLFSANLDERLGSQDCQILQRLVQEARHVCRVRGY